MLAINQELTAEQRILKAMTAIMGCPKYVALGGALLIGTHTVKEDVPTAYTDGKNCYYGRAFVDSLSDAELRFLILHETYHMLFRHLTSWQHLYEEDAQLANKACDYVINLMITDENKDGFATMPVDDDGNYIGLLDEQYRNMHEGDVYAALRKEKENNPDQQEGEGEGDGAGLDEHDWEGAQEMSAEEQRELSREIDQAIRQGALTAGKVGGGGSLAVEQLLQPEVDWRAALREFITSTCRGNDDSTWRRPSRRHMAMGILRPSGSSEQVGELLIVPDTSLSMGQRELTRCITEIKGVCDTVKPESVRVLYWDTEVRGDELYGNGGLPIEQLVQTTKPKGGGGTTISCVTDYIRDKGIKAQAVIVLTDGFLGGVWGTWDVPVLWGILNNKLAKPKTGKTLHIKV